MKEVQVEYYDIFARHRMDIEMNTEFKMRLTPKDDKAIYSRNLPMPIHLNENLIAELAPMHKYGIIRFTSLKISKSFCTPKTQRKYTSPCGSQENQHTDCTWLD